MSSYCLKCGENAKNIILQVSRAINDRIILLIIIIIIIIILKCTVCGNKKSTFI